MKLVLKVVRLIVFVLCASVLSLGGVRAAFAAETVIVGLHEKIYVSDLDIHIPAKLDTGATTSSISAINIKRFKRKGQSWVRFNLAFEGAPNKTFEYKVVRNSRIKRRASDYDPATEKSYSVRTTVNLKVRLGDKEEEIEVGLTDRRRFKYPFLVGSKALKKFKVLIDPATSFTLGKPEASE